MCFPWRYRPIKLLFYAFHQAAWGFWPPSITPPLKFQHNSSYQWQFLPPKTMETGLSSSAGLIQASNGDFRASFLGQHALIAPSFVPLTWTHAACCSHVCWMFTTRYCLKQTTPEAINPVPSSLGKSLFLGTYSDHFKFYKHCHGSINRQDTVRLRSSLAFHSRQSALRRELQRQTWPSYIKIWVFVRAEMESWRGNMVYKQTEKRIAHCLCIHWFWLKLCLTAGKVGPHVNTLPIKPPNAIFLVRRRTN